MTPASVAEPMTRQIPRALGWALDYLVSGALLRVLRTSWAFGLVLVYFQMMLIWWLVLSVVGGGLIAYAAHALGLPVLLALAIGIACAFAIFALLRPLADRWFVVQINSHWPHLCAFAPGERAQVGPVTVDLHHEPAVSERSQQGEDRERAGNADGERQQHGQAQSVRGIGDEPAADDRQHEPPDQHHLEVDQHQAEGPGCPQHAQECAADEVVERPAERARDLARHRLGHVVADHVLFAEELAARRHPPGPVGF